ncbi:hypothetical protein Tco_0516484 [Tanacetum coccineum]
MDWSKISPKILDVLAHKHIVYYEDYPSFAGVCKSWHLAALQAVKGNGPPSRLPSLMLSEKIGDEEFRELFILSNKTVRKIRLPEVHETTPYPPQKTHRGGCLPLTTTMHDLEDKVNVKDGGVDTITKSPRHLRLLVVLSVTKSGDHWRIRRLCLPEDLAFHARRIVCCMHLGIGVLE